MLRVLILCLVMVLSCRSAALASEPPVIRLTMADAIKAAVESNLEVRAERYTPAQQEAEYQKNRGIYDPALQLLASYADASSISSFYLSPPDRQADRTTHS